MPHDHPPTRPALTSLRQRYAEFRTRELDFYKEVVSRPTIMQVADRARERLESRDELVLHDLTLASAVDEIIAERLRLPTFRSWSRHRERQNGSRVRVEARTATAAQLLLPLIADHASAPVLLLHTRASDAWETLVQSGSRVVVVEPEAEDRARIVERAALAGHSDAVRVASSYEELGDDDRYASVCYTPAACADYADWEVEAMIESLKARTLDRGVHVLEGLLQERSAAPRAVLRRGYASWTRRVQRGRREWTLVASRHALA